MTFTFTINSWVIPTIITIISIIVFFITSLIDRNTKGGYINIPLYTILALLIGGTATIISWFVYFSMILLK